MLTDQWQGRTIDESAWVRRETLSHHERGRPSGPVDPSMIITLTTERGTLFVDAPRDHQTALFASSPSTLFVKIRPAQMTFIKDGEQVTGLDWREHGETLRANKIE